MKQASEMNGRLIDLSINSNSMQYSSPKFFKQTHHLRLSEIETQNIEIGLSTRIIGGTII